MIYFAFAVFTLLTAFAFTNPFKEAVDRNLPIRALLIAVMIVHSAFVTGIAYSVLFK